MNALDPYISRSCEDLRAERRFAFWSDDGGAVFWVLILLSGDEGRQPEQFEHNWGLSEDAGLG